MFPLFYDNLHFEPIPSRVVNEYSFAKINEVEPYSDGPLGAH